MVRVYYLSSVVVNKSVSFPDLSVRGTAFQKMVSAVIKEKISYIIYVIHLYIMKKLNHSIRIYLTFFTAVICNFFKIFNDPFTVVPSTC